MVGPVRLSRVRASVGGYEGLAFVNNDMEEVVRALKKDGQAALADDLIKLRDAWRDASQAAFDSFNRK